MGVRSLLQSAENRFWETFKDLWFFYIVVFSAVMAILIFYGIKIFDYQRTKYYAEPITEKMISKFSPCEMRRAEQRIEMLKRPLIRRDLGDFENDCDKEKEALEMEKVKVKQAEILNKQKALLKARSNA